uniref:Adrenomedullin n=1 Tax=Pelusios castaneus TaxID=367368 RepID=A0A8C8SX53_9SAUR
MKLVHVALLYLGSAAVLGVDAAPKPDPPSQLARTPPARHSPVRPTAPLTASSSPPVSRSRPEDARIRVKRYRHSLNSFPHIQAMRLGCRFGTCTIQQLAHQIYQLTDKDKDDTAPISKISPQGYGRRRRSVPAPSRTRLPTLARSSSRSDSAPARPERLQARLRAPPLRT